MNSNPSQSVAPATPQHEHRTCPRILDAAVAFIQPLHAAATTTYRVEMIDSSHPKGVGVRAMIPVPRGTPVVLSIAHHPPMEGLFLCRVAHCTKLGNGRYHLGMSILEQRDGNLNTTRIPDAWRKA